MVAGGEELYAFFKDVRDENLLGIDVDPAMINICNETLGRGIYKTANPQPPVEFINVIGGFLFTFT